MHLLINLFFRDVCLRMMAMMVMLVLLLSKSWRCRGSGGFSSVCGINGILEKRRFSIFWNWLLLGNATSLIRGYSCWFDNNWWRIRETSRVR